MLLVYTKFITKVGGLPVKELNLLELEFLSMNDYNIYISLEELQQYGDQLLSHSIREREKYLHDLKKEHQLTHNNNIYYSQQQ